MGEGLNEQSAEPSDFELSQFLRELKVKEEIDMSDKPKKRKRKLLSDYNLPPYKVPDDWEPTSETVKKLDKMLEGLHSLPEAWRKRWWEEFLEEQSKDDSKGQCAPKNRKIVQPPIEDKPEEEIPNRKEIDMSSQPKKRKRKLLSDYNLPPYKVPDDWEPTSETVKELDKMLEEFNRGIPEAWRKRWWQEFLEEQSKND